MKQKQYLYLFILTIIVILLSFLFQYFSILWIGMARFNASDKLPGDISVLAKIYYLLLYPIIFTLFITNMIFVLNKLIRKSFNIIISNKVYIGILILVFVALEVRFAFYLF